MNDKQMSKEALIEKYQLIAHPEGGYFREIFRSEAEVASPVHNQTRACVTHIYFLLAQNDISRFHKVCHDEIWNFYDGDPIELITYNGIHVKKNTVGHGCNDYFHVVKAGVYQAAQSTGKFSLAGCTVAPGFDFKDFSFLKEDKNDLKKFNPFLSSYQKFL